MIWHEVVLTVGQAPMEHAVRWHRLRGIAQGLRTALGGAAVLAVLAAAAAGIRSQRGGGTVAVREPLAAAAKPASASVDRGTFCQLQTWKRLRSV